MGTFTLRPNATTVSAGWTAIGAATHHAATSDNSDASYSRDDVLGGQTYQYNLELGTSVLPALSQVRSVTPRVRHSLNDMSNTPQLIVSLYYNKNGTLYGVNPYNSMLYAIDTAIRTYTFPSISNLHDGTPWLQEQIDSMLFAFTGFQPNLIEPNPGCEHRVYEIYVDVVYNEAPVVVVTGPTEGSTVVTSRPTATWTYTDPEGDVQERFQVKVFTAAQYGIAGFNPDTSPNTYDSGVIYATATSHLIAADLTNNTTYRVYVKAVDVGSSGRYGNWDNNTFTVTLDPPAVPVLTATPDDALARIILTLQGRTNMLTNNQSSLETDASGWANNGNTTLARSVAQFAHGVASLSMTAIAAGNLNALTTPNGVAGFPVVAGKTYTALASFRSAVTARPVKVSIAYWDAAGVYFAETQGATTDDTTAGWTQVSLTMVAPANAVFAAITVQVVGCALGEVHYADKMSLSPGTSIVWTRGGFSSTHKFTIERSIDGGITWVAVRNANGASFGVGQFSTVYDYESPPGVASQYRARVSVIEALNTLTSANTNSIVATSIVTKFWLKVPENSALNMIVKNFTPVLKSSRKEQQGKFIPLGRNRPVVVRGALTGLEFSLGLTFIGKADFAAFEAIRAAQKTVLLQTDTDEQWYVSIDEEVEHNLFFGSERKTNPHRKVTLAMTEVESS